MIDDPLNRTKVKRGSDLPQSRLCEESVTKAKREAYRLIWNKRDSKVPRKSITWGDWFKQQYGEDIEKYHHRLYMKNMAKLYSK